KYGDDDSAFFVSLIVRFRDAASETTRSRRRVPCRYLSSMRSNSVFAAPRQSAPARTRKRRSYSTRVYFVSSVCIVADDSGWKTELHQELSREPACSTLLRGGSL